MISVLMQVIGATIGTIAFSLLYGVPKKYYPCCGIVGGVGWLVYLMAKSIFGTALGAFFSAIAIVLLSRLFAVRKHCWYLSSCARSWNLYDFLLYCGQ